MVRLEQSIAGVAREFVRVRALNMRGVDLEVFDFDYDLDWYALILTPDEQVIGRFGGHDATEGTRYRTFAGLRRLHERRPRPAAGPAEPVASTRYRRKLCSN